MTENPKDLLIEGLEELGYEDGKTIILHGSLADDSEYPNSFFTFDNYDSPFGEYRDNEPFKTDWEFDLYFYSNNPALVDETMLNAINKLKEYGFIAKGKGFDAISDTKTHTGRGNKIIYIERN